MLAGPHPSATDAVEWNYAQAVSAMRAGDKPAAMVGLGRAAKLMQGLTVPHLATDTAAGVPSYGRHSAIS